MPEKADQKNLLGMALPLEATFVHAVQVARAHFISPSVSAGKSAAMGDMAAALNTTK